MTVFFDKSHVFSTETDLKDEADEEMEKLTLAAQLTFFIIYSTWVSLFFFLLAYYTSDIPNLFILAPLVWIQLLQWRLIRIQYKATLKLKDMKIWLKIDILDFVIPVELL